MKLFRLLFYSSIFSIPETPIFTSSFKSNSDITFFILFLHQITTTFNSKSAIFLCFLNDYGAKIRKFLITLVFFTRFNAIKGRLSTNNPPLLPHKCHLLELVRLS